MPKSTRFAVPLLLLCTLIFSTVGCGSSRESFVSTGNVPTTPLPPDEVANAVIVLRSELESARAISGTVSQLVFTTTSGSTSSKVVSAPISKAPEIKVTVPADSTKLVIDYLDSTNTVVEKWGTDLNLESGKEFVITGVDPIRLTQLGSISILPPFGAGNPNFGVLSIPRNFLQPFRAQATKTDNTTQDVTELVDWTLTPASGLSSVSATGLVKLDSEGGTLRADFLGKTATKTLVSVRTSPARGAAPFFQFDSPATKVGEITRYTVMLLFDDRKLREVVANTIGVAGPGLALGSGNEIVALAPVSTSVTLSVAGMVDSTFSVTGTDDASRFFANRQLVESAPVSLDSKLMAADLNGDGKADIAGTNGTLSRLVIHRGNGDGTFQAAATENTGLPSGGNLLFAVNDFDRDGFEDLALASTSSATLRVRSGIDGSYRSFTLPGTPRKLLTLSDRALGVVTADNRYAFLNPSSSSPINFSVNLQSFAGGIQATDQFGVLDRGVNASRDVLQMRLPRQFETHVASNGNLGEAPISIGSGAIRDFDTFTGAQSFQGLLVVVDSLNAVIVQPSEFRQPTILSNRTITDPIRRLLPCRFDFRPRAARNGIVGAMFVIGDTEIRLLNGFEVQSQPRVTRASLSGPILPGMAASFLQTAVTGDFNNDRIPDLVGLVNSHLVTALPKP